MNDQWWQQPSSDQPSNQPPPALPAWMQPPSSNQPPPALPAWMQQPPNQPPPPLPAWMQQPSSNRAPNQPPSALPVWGQPPSLTQPHNQLPSAQPTWVQLPSNQLPPVQPMRMQQLPNQPSPAQPIWMQPPPNQLRQTQYGDQYAQNYPFPPQPMSPPADVVLPTKKGFFSKRVGCVPLWVLIVLMVLVLLPAMISAGKGNNTSTPDSATPSTNSTGIGNSDTPIATVAPTPKPTPTPTPKPTPTPTKTLAQIETEYKGSTTNTTVVNLDKNGSAEKGKDVHFLCRILNFVKDTTGITAGANVTDATSYTGSVVQVIFTSGTDITRLNEGDILEVWGTDQGVFSGTNAFGGTVQEVGIAAKYMRDQTTNYQADIQDNKV